MAFELTEQIERHLIDDELAWLTTVTPSGRPAPRLVWFIWDGSTITIYSEETAAKLRHIRANDQVTVHFNSAADGGDVVVISGRAELVQDAPLPFHGWSTGKYAARIEATGYTREFLDSYNVAIRVTPERAWTIPA